MAVFGQARNRVMKSGFSKFGFAFLGVLLGIVSTSPAFAVQVDDIAQNIVTGSEQLPGLVTACAYLMGLLLGVLALFKLKDHVENPSQTPLRVPIVRFIIGGALFSLPIVYEAAARAINAGDFTVYDQGAFTFTGLLSGIMGTVGGLGGVAPNFNGVLRNMVNGLQNTPGLITALAYLLGLILGFAGLLKIKEHVENPDQVKVSESIIRLLTAGALFALPMVYKAMANAINGGNGTGFMGTLAGIFQGFSWFWSPYTGLTGSICNPAGGIGAGGSIGNSMCSLVFNTGGLPVFLSDIGYLIGIVMGVWVILKIRDHVLNPQQTHVWEGISRLLAGGLFFALPVTVEAIRASMAPAGAGTGIGAIIGILTGSGNGSISGYNPATGAPAGCTGLDGALNCAMIDILGPLHSLLNFFSFAAGIVLIMIGISRLIKSAQEGARGPGGMGTIMTFLAGGVLISYNDFMRTFTMSFFNDTTTRTYAKMKYVTGMSQAEQAHTYLVINSILKFMIIIGLISFIRGIFIIRSVAEGNGQASLMAGVTHMVGGALAVNLGPLLNAVQTTLGITTFGIQFA
jgi:hypothetical protein